MHSNVVDNLSDLSHQFLSLVPVAAMPSRVCLLATAALAAAAAVSASGASKPRITTDAGNLNVCVPP